MGEWSSLLFFLFLLNFLLMCGSSFQSFVKTDGEPLFTGSEAYHTCMIRSGLDVRSLTVEMVCFRQVQESLDLLSTSPERSGSLSRSSSSLDLSPEVKGTRPRSEDVFEIICNEVVLPLNISLAAVRQFVWRQSAELVMYYRRKSVTQGDDR